MAWHSKKGGRKSKGKSSKKSGYSSKKNKKR